MLNNGEPYLSLQDMVDRVVDTHRDNLYYMIPTHLITYLYGSGMRTVTLMIETFGNDDQIEVQIVDPPLLVNCN